MILKCQNCGETKEVDSNAKVGDLPVLDWWASVNQTCKDCRRERIMSLEDFRREFDATVFGVREIPAP